MQLYVKVDEIKDRYKREDKDKFKDEYVKVDEFKDEIKDEYKSG